jgi:hypothetical protein
MGDEWYIERDEQVAGPFTGRQLKELAASGRLSRNDGIRRGRKGEFVAASQARGLLSVASNEARQEAPPVDLGATKVAVSMPMTAIGASSVSQLRSKLLLACKRIKLAGLARRVTEAASSLCQIAHSAREQLHQASSIRRHISTLLARPHLPDHTLGEGASKAIDVRVPLPQLGQFGKYGFPLLVGLSIGFLFSLCFGRFFSHMLLGGLVSIGISQLAMASLPAIALDRFPLRFSAVVVAVLFTSGFLWRASDNSDDHPFNAQPVKRYMDVEGYKTPQVYCQGQTKDGTPVGRWTIGIVTNTGAYQQVSVRPGRDRTDRVVHVLCKMLLCCEVPGISIDSYGRLPGPVHISGSPVYYLGAVMGEPDADLPHSPEHPDNIDNRIWRYDCVDGPVFLRVTFDRHRDVSAFKASYYNNMTYGRQILNRIR